MDRLYGPADGEVGRSTHPQGRLRSRLGAAAEPEDVLELDVPEPDADCGCPKVRLKVWITKRRGNLSSPLTNAVIWP